MEFNMKKMVYLLLLVTFISCGDDDNETSNSQNNSQYQYSLCGVVNNQAGFNNSFATTTISTNGLTYTVTGQNQQAANSLQQLVNGQQACVYSNTLTAQNAGQNIFYAEAVSVGNTTGFNNNNTNYQYNFCGTLYYRNANTGGNNSFVLASGNGTYAVYPDSAQASSVLSNQNLQSQACIYTNRNIQQGYEGGVIYAQQISFQ